MGLSLCLLITLGVFSSTPGQQAEKDSPDKAPLVTASVTSDGVRIAAPSAVVQLRLEVYDDAGQKIFDTEQPAGDVLDWHLQTSAGPRVGEGTYLCVVTVKSPSGRSNQKLGLVTVAAQSVTARSASVADLNPVQAQVLGGIEGDDKGLAVVPAETAPPLTVLTHTGDEAQLTRTRGALSLRIGDFFSGKDREQMRLTEDGNLGLGTDRPQAKLDVVGAIRTTEGIKFADNTVLTSAASLPVRRDAQGNAIATVGGSGTTGRVTKWADGANGTLGDSPIYDDGNGNVGIGTTSPVSQLHLAGPNGVSAITIDTPGAQKFRFQTVPGVPNWGGLTINSKYTYPSGWQLDDPNVNGYFFKLDTRGGNANGVSNGLWLYRVPAGAGFHTDETPLFGVSSSSAYFAGNLGIGTNSPAAKLDVAGDVKITGANNGLIFPDGSKMTTAASGGGSMTGTSIVAAIDDPATQGTISDSRISTNVPRLNSANTFGASQTVNGTVQSTSGGFKFPDGSVQTSAADKVYTTFGFGSLEIAAPGATSSIAELNLPAGSYMVTASVQFENRGLFNKRLVECQMIDEALWSARIDGSGGVTDYLPVTLHTVITHGGNIKLYCQALDGGSPHSNVFATARRLTAVRIGDLVTQ